MSEAALTLSTAPTDSVRCRMIRFLVEWRRGDFFFFFSFFFGPSVGLTALFDCRACLGKLDKDDVAEAFLSIVRDGHRADSTLVVKRDHLVIWRVSLRWRRKEFVLVMRRKRTGEWDAEDSLIMVRLRESGTGRKAC